MTDAAPAVCNADARSRAQTRGLLMALSRDRAAYFIGRPAVSLTLAVVTLGILPLIRRSRRFLSIERMEWSELLELSSWLTAYTRLGSRASLLERFASDRLRTARSRRTRYIACFTFCGLAAALACIHQWLTPDGRLATLWCGFFTCIAVAWLLQLLLLTTHVKWLRDWIGHVNQLLYNDDKREIDQPRGMWLIFAGLGVPLLVVQFLTALPVVLLLVVLTRLMLARHLQQFRQTQLHLLERLLEYMDDTGLPVEYDVVALNPDEIAAMIG